ncbi:inducibility protein 3 [Apiospora saccharicola]|uniref:Inducibility protein 3 n=1 Tax=Apiospora saccharicola TaxID=335842 RepID=A0ABR1VRR6_9PEZI
MVVDRSEIMANNKSLRLIKNELENLLEKGVIDDNVFDSIHQMLPNETPLSGAGARSAATSNASPAPSQNPTSPPVNSMANLALSQTPSQSPAPPAYNTTGPPALPTRNNPPPPPPPSKPVIAHARALYKYNAADARDLSFERDDKIAVHEYMNADWWMGRNQRTGAEGIFPKNYVQIEGGDNGNGNGYMNEKAATPGAGYYQQPTYAQPQQPQYGGGYQAPPPQQNPYNSSAPPMAIAEGSNQPAPAPAPAGEPEKEGMGKKMGKKFGNAALFGAGATFGGNIVNSIF